MHLTSLRNKIFLFVVAILLLGAGLVMVVTQQGVTHTVATNEERAIDNVLNLLIRDSVARWVSLLNEKVVATRHAREPLIQYNILVASVLSMYHQQEEQGLLSRAQAQALALQWISQLDPGLNRRAYILNHNLDVLGSSRSELTGTQMANRHDVRGRLFSDVAQQELGTSNYRFIIYRNQVNYGPVQATELRYAIFARFLPWNWIISISDNAQRMADQFEQQHRNMRAAVAETVTSIQLAGSGFVFIMNSGHAITPLPKRHQALLRAASDGATLTSLLEATPASSAITSFEFNPQETETPQDQGSWIIKSAFVKPLKWAVVAAVPATALSQPATELRNRIGLLFLLGLAAALAVSWLLAARITGPLHQLSVFARRLPERDLTQTDPLPTQIAQLPHRYHDEVGRLASAFIHMDEQLRDKIQHLLQEASRRERFESELLIARGIQVGLLPAGLPQHAMTYIDLHATMIPAKEVGGDLYDYFMLPNGHLCFAIGDVSDKGVPAALFMAVTRTLVQAYVKDDIDPARIMERINTHLSANNPKMMFVTLIVGVLNLHTGLLRWANGGHPPPCILQCDGSLRPLENRSGPACGIVPGQRYRAFTTQLHNGETLFGYSDGVTEAMNPQDQQYGKARVFMQLSKPGSTLLSAQSHVTAIIDGVHAFTENSEQSDDITVIVIKRMQL